MKDFNGPSVLICLCFYLDSSDEKCWYLLSVACCLLSVVFCLLSGVWSLLSVVCCSLSVVCVCCVFQGVDKYIYTNVDEAFHIERASRSLAKTGSFGPFSSVIFSCVY